VVSSLHGVYTIGAAFSPFIGGSLTDRFGFEAAFAGYAVASAVKPKPPVVPNAFSPNGDGINDTWVIRYLNEYPSADVEVFNRYGQPVYHATGGYTTPWDGTYKGQPLPVGTYYWIIRPGSGRKQISGSVTILR